MGAPELPSKRPREMKDTAVDPQAEGKRVIEAAAKTVPTKPEQNRITPSEREAIENLASDFPEFVYLDEKNPGQFVVHVPFFYAANELMTMRGPIASSTYVISGNMAKEIRANDGRRFGRNFGSKPPIAGDTSLYVLGGALQICKEATRVQEEYYKKMDDKNAEKKYHEAMKALGAEFGEWMKKPTRTLRNST